MKILVTGGCGYIGSHVARQLHEGGHTVHTVDNLSHGFKDNLMPGIIFHLLDLKDCNQLEALFREEKFEAVMHFAASIAVGESVEKPLEYYQNNVGNTIQLLTMCKKYAVQYFVFSSTAAVYDFSSKLEPISESFSLRPASPYGWSKLFSEQIVQDCAQAEGLKYSILRYFNVAGADPLGRMGQRQPEATHLIKAALQAASGLRKEVHIWGTDYPTRDGTGVRDYIHVEDLAQAHVLALNALSRTSSGPSGIFNVGYGQGYSVREVLQEVERVTGTSLKIVESSRRAGDAVQLVADSTKIKKTLGWAPQYANLTKVIEDAWNFERKTFIQ